MVVANPTGWGAKGQAWKAYWSLHQRFFKLLCVSMKVPVVVKQAREALANGQCVVIGLQTTVSAVPVCVCVYVIALDENKCTLTPS